MGKKNFEKWALARVKEAMREFGMVAGGDRVAVGLSGGKDSGFLLYALEQIRRTVPVKFELLGVFLDLGFDMDVSSLEKFCVDLGVPFRRLQTEIGRIVFEIRKEENPCALCSTLRRGALHQLALAEGCGKVALGHHLDDLVTTFFLSLIFNGQIRTFAPVTFLDRTGLHMVRPLIYLEGDEVAELARIKGIPVMQNPCPASRSTKREEIDNLLASLYTRYPDLKKKTLSAIRSIDLQNLWPKS